MFAYISVLTALGWALLASFWQMALLWAAYYFITTGNKRFSAAGKHNLVLLFIVFNGEWFIYTFFHLLKEPEGQTVSGLLPVSNVIGQWIPFISILYIVILTVRFLQFVIHYRRRQNQKIEVPASAIIQSFTDRFTRILGITKQVTVYLSQKAVTAETSGFLKPLILLPVSLITRLSPAQIEAILIHELYHIRRNDYLINIIVSGYRTVFFFNPFAHMFYKALEKERELACDDGVLELGYDPSVYAEALFSLEKHRHADPGFSLAVDGKNAWLLMERIRRVLGKPETKEKRFSRGLYVGAGAAFLFFSLQFISLPGHQTARVISGSVIPVHYELPEEKMILPVSSFVNSSLQKKRLILPPPPKQVIRQKKIKEAEKLALVVEKDPEETDRPEEAFYVDNNIPRNFSNESESGIITTPVPEVQGSPYVPSSSLIYDVRPENEAEDSMQQLLTQNSVNEAEKITRLHSVILLKKLKREIEKSNRELREVELKNKYLILLDKKNTQPILNKVHKELKVRNQELNNLQLHIKVSTAEIIHI